jgi:hypothetical protein
MMSSVSKRICGVILLTVPSIQYGGYFLLQVLSGEYPDLDLTEFQRSMFRAGHAHAGVLVILSLLVQWLADNARLTQVWEWIARMAFPVAALLISGGFFAGATGEGITEPTGGIALLYAGIVILAAGFLILGIGLLRSK